VAKARGVPFDLTLFFEIGTEELLARLAGRARTIGRSDDTEQTIRHLLEVYAARPSRWPTTMSGAASWSASTRSGRST
jgi:adenylate kinase family enzyme